VRRNPRSRGSASSEPPDPYPTALALLGQRELSEAQLRARLLRRGCEPAAVDDTILRLRRDRTLDDRRVASAAARLEAGIRGRGPARVRQRLQAMGLASDVVHDAVADVFREIDEGALLDAAVERRLRGQALDELDERGRARLVRGLVGRGFSLAAVLKKLKA
jgi:SOS response regulatory protein OraA/RecX